MTFFVHANKQLFAGGSSSNLYFFCSCFLIPIRFTSYIRLVTKCVTSHLGINNSNMEMVPETGMFIRKYVSFH